MNNKIFIVPLNFFSEPKCLFNDNFANPYLSCETVTQVGNVAQGLFFKIVAPSLCVLFIRLFIIVYSHLLFW